MNIFNGITTLFTRNRVKVISSDISVEKEKHKEDCAEICETDKAQVEQKLTVDEPVSPALKHVDNNENGMDDTRSQTDTKVKNENPVKTSSTVEDVIPSRQTESEKPVENEEAAESKKPNERSETAQCGEVPSDLDLCKDVGNVSEKSSAMRDTKNTSVATIGTDGETKVAEADTADHDKDRLQSSVDDIASTSIQKDESKLCEPSEDSLETQNDDCLTYLLNNQSPEFLGNFGVVSYLGFSMQGYSHSVNNIKCQDKCAIREVGLSEKYVVAGIADGLGSCAFSDEGASVAVSSALDEIEKFLSQNEKPTDDDIIDILKHSMRTAYESVEKYADQKGKEFNEYYSTLTVVIYNGKEAFVAHAGDDGAVVLADSGFYGLVTTRHKGDTVNSVVPLQGETNWEFMIVRDIVGVVMATDGVLDAFVKREKGENRVFFPFVQILTKPEHDKKDILEKYKSLFKTREIQENITDDITFMAMVNDETMKKTEFQPFDEKEWFRKNRERSVSIYKALYPDQELTEDMAESWLDRDKVLLLALEQLKML